jgi:hypothetical protein
VVWLTVPALYVKAVNQDLLSWKAYNKIGVRIILDEDPDISGLYPLDKEKQQHLEESIPFIGVPTDLYLLKIEKKGLDKIPQAEWLLTMASASDALHEPNYQAKYPILQRTGEVGGQ